MTQVDDLSRSIVAFEQSSTMAIVVDMSQSSWLVAGVVPGLDRRPLKKVDPNPATLLRLLEGWRDQAVRSGQLVSRIVLAFEAGRDGFWLARWLRARDIESYVIHSTSVAVSREHRRAKTDRLDTEMLIRVFLGWLRGESRHCKMVAVPTLSQEDAKRPSRERESLVGERTRIINRMKAALIRLGIRDFKPGLLKAPQRLGELRTPRGGADPAEHAGRAPARYDAASLGPRADRRNRTGTIGAFGTSAVKWTACHGAFTGQRHRCRGRDSGHARARGSVTKPA
jgi:transposase